MLSTQLIIKSEVWQIRINVDMMREGCNILSREIWASGERLEIEDKLERYIEMAVRYEYGDNDLPEKGIVEYTANKILMAIGNRI